jgi:tetratricopeptide (TPR) repeat protein
MKTAADFVTNLSEYLNKYPYSERGTSYLYSLARVVKLAKDAGEAQSLIDSLIKNTGSAPEPLKGEIYRRCADALFNQSSYKDAAELAQKSIDTFNDNEYLEFKKKQNDVTMAELVEKNPNFKKREFDIERTRGFYVGTKTDVYNLLGKCQAELGKFEQAEKAYRESFAIKKNKNAALGIAHSAERNGKDDAALEYATIAALTGKLEPSEMEYFHSIYAKQHQGNVEGVEQYLDEQYKKTYVNPVKGEKYDSGSRHSVRAVLAEFFTGAGCIPCIPVDYTFETALKDYTPKELVLLVYHWHAPVWDPLGNYSADSRVKYYGIQGAPTIIFDGKKSDKEGDYYGSDGEANEIQEIAKGLNDDLRAELEVPAEAKISLNAKRNGQNVSVKINTDQINNVSDDVSLQIALVENEVTYSGENGLRFQMMVVRALAGDNTKREFGFKVDPTKSIKFDYIFDINKIVEQNASYYDTFAVEKTAEFKQRFGGTVPEGLKVEFKYKKNKIDGKNLSVVAFLQDSKTKKVLQSAIVNLASK